MTEKKNTEIKVTEENGHKIYSIDVGNLPKVKAEQYLRDVMMCYKKIEG